MPVFTKNGVKVLFVHIPKAAGSSIESAFMKEGFHMHFHDHGPKKKNSINSFCLCSPQHMHAAQLQSIFKLNEFDAIFTVVRHPVSRFLSEFAMRNPHFYGAEDRDVAIFFEKAISFYSQDPFYLDNHIRKQTEFLLPNMKIFKLENGLSHIKDYFNANFDICLDIQHKLASKSLKIGASSDIKLTENTRKSIIDFYQDDMIELGYEK